MKPGKLVMILLLLTIAVLKNNNIYGQPSGREVQNFNFDWKFCKGDIANGQDPGLNDLGWRKLDLPHDWSIEGHFNKKFSSSTGYLPGGIGWYRKSFTISANEKNRKVFISFDGIYNNSEVWINGTYLGKRPNGYISFQYDLTPYIKPGKENLIAVKVDHSKYGDSRWYTGSGIYRDVKLILTSPLHIKQWIISQNMDIYGPKLWDIDNPNLYSLITVVQDSDMLDSQSTHVGFRSIRFDTDKGFFLNGKNMKLKGICMHHDAGTLGSAVPRKVIERRLNILKEAGCNAIRTSHNPFSSDFLELCDEKGFLVIGEAFDEWELPKRKWIEGWNVGIPGKD